MAELEQSGNFRGTIAHYGVNEAESGAIAIMIEVHVEDIFHEGEWHDWREHGFTVRGDIWVVKKDGSLNKPAIESLINYAGWNGSFASVTDHTWEPQPVAVAVNKDVYKDQARFRISFVNAYNSTPGGGGNVTPEAAKALDGKLGSQLRGLVANKSRNEAKPSGAKPAKPAKQEKPKPSATKSPPASQPAAAAPDDDIPF